MKKPFIKYIITWITVFIWLSVLTAFSSSIFFQNIQLVHKLSNNIYLSSEKLNNTLLIFKSSYDISNASIKSSCETKTKFITNKNDLYLFELSINDINCSNPNFYLKSRLWILSNLKLNLISDYKLHSILLDYSSIELANSLVSLNNNASKYKIFSDYKSAPLDDKYNFASKKRIYEELLYKEKIVTNILELRKNKYLIPIAWKKLPTKDSKLPNAGRPYRASNTDWIHHSWDIDTSFWQKVIALDDWIIIRIVKYWDNSDLKKLRNWNNLSNDDRIRNLDILRWNQVWIKTMKWELVMYNHFDKVVDSLKEWTMIKRWTYLWTVWITWVSDANYTDFHLDFSISKNPYNIWKAWSYEITDYMSWPWLFKWKSKEYILKHQYDIFSSN